MSDVETSSDSEMKLLNTQKEVDDNSCIDIDHYRKLVRSFIDMRRYKTALFWSEKVATLTKNDPIDIYWLGQCMFLLREYNRAAHTIRQHGYERTHLLCHYLCVESLFEAKDYGETIELINSVETEELIMSEANESTEFSRTDIIAYIWLLKGKVLEAMDNRTVAMSCYINALQSSIYCSEALDALTQHEMLMSWEETDLLNSLQFDQQVSNEIDVKILKLLYESKLRKYYETENPMSNAEQTPIGNLNSIKSIRELSDKIKQEYGRDPVKLSKPINSRLFTPIQKNILSPGNKLLPEFKLTPTTIGGRKTNQTLDANRFTPITGTQRNRVVNTAKTNRTLIDLNEGLARLQTTCDIRVAEAEKLYYNSDYQKAKQILDEVLMIDPYHTPALTVLIGCLVSLKESNKLFYIAHKLVDLYPDQAISWYSVGCYYDLIGKSEPARRYLSKATSLDRLYGPAWLAYGHSFAAENEHDQAMAAYFKATQLMRGCHLPLLYIGVECGLTKNLELAQKFFYQAMAIAPLDVFVLHELGFIKFEYELYDEAEEILRTTLNMVKSLAKKNEESISPRWEPLLNNLGHCCRKNKKYSEALQFHQQALSLKPLSAATYTAIGFVQSLMGRLEDAVESLHRSLALKRDDIFTSTLLKYCVEDLMDDDQLPDNFVDVDAGKDDIKRFPTDEAMIDDAGHTPVKLNCQKLKFDDDSNVLSSNSDTIDTSFDMSMEV